ncbi:hypothetical protein [Pseudomonas sp. HD6421]|uniref:hypothetical protein n=1 Tax=Pseudomonas sp. HD6421 TaxID=2860319 RepID=UPI0021BB3B52|nr:hypothetical protein [Pseudomonas sp. HD6421]
MKVAIVRQPMPKKRCARSVRCPQAAAEKEKPANEGGFKERSELLKVKAALKKKPTNEVGNDV